MFQCPALIGFLFDAMVKCRKGKRDAILPPLSLGYPPFISLKDLIRSQLQEMRKTIYKNCKAGILLTYKKKNFNSFVNYSRTKHAYAVLFKKCCHMGKFNTFRFCEVGWKFRERHVGSLVRLQVSNWKRRNRREIDAFWPTFIQISRGGNVRLDNDSELISFENPLLSSPCPLILLVGRSPPVSSFLFLSHPGLFHWRFTADLEKFRTQNLHFHSASNFTSIIISTSAHDFLESILFIFNTLKNIYVKIEQSFISVVQMQ